MEKQISPVEEIKEERKRATGEKFGDEEEDLEEEDEEPKKKDGGIED